MAPRQPRTKEQAIDEIRNQIISKYLETTTSGLTNPNDFFLISAERRLKALKPSNGDANDFISYYATLAILEAAKGRFSQAKELYLKAISLNLNSSSHFSNYNNILIRTCDFEEAQEGIENHFKKGGEKYDLLFNLYTCGLRNLDFRSFDRVYNEIKSKDVLSKTTKRDLELLYDFSRQLQRMPDDLASINVSIDTFSEFFDVLYGFHAKNLYDQFNVRFQIENEDEQYVVVEVFAKATTEELVALTIQFEDVLVRYAVKHGRSDILSKFLVYYKNKEMTQEELNYRSSIYLGMNEGLVM